MDTLKQKDFGFTSESLRVRCPHCRKLYLVQRADIRETRPRFECVQCRERFWLSVEDITGREEIVGLPLQVKESPKPQKVEACPKCRATIAVGSLECGSCGVVISKWKAARSSKASPIPASETLHREWQKVIDGFGSATTHDDFIASCRRDKNLPFAAQQYANLLQVLPGDEQIQQRIREIENLALAQVAVTEKKMGLRMPTLWQWPLIIGGLMILLGLALPLFRNMVGAGAAVIFVSLALRWQFGPR